MHSMKNAGLMAFGICVIAGLSLLGGWLLEGTVSTSVRGLLHLSQLFAIGTIFCVLILLPLSRFRVTRTASYVGFVVASYIFSSGVWLYGFIVTYTLWGGIGVFVGLCLGGIGVVPLGIVAAALHGMWQQVAELVFGIVITFAARAFSRYLVQRIDAAAYA